MADAPSPGANTVRKELLLPQSPDQVWRALTSSATLAQWMYPNDFEPRLGHRFTFQVPPKPAVGFEGLTVRCEVLTCDPPRRLVFSWSAGAPVEDTRVSFTLEAHAGESGGAPEGTRLLFEHSGFDLGHPFGKQAFKGADYGWGDMLGRLTSLLGADSAHPR